MLETAILKLPPDVRAAFAVKFFRSFGLRSTVFGPSNIIKAPARVHHAFQRASVARRSYATVHADDTAKVWSQYRKDHSATPKVGTAEPQQNAPSTNLASSGESSEARELQQLLAVIEEKLHVFGENTQLRDYVNRALNDQNSMGALRYLANSPVQMWRNEKTGLQETKSTSVNLTATSTLSKGQRQRRNRRERRVKEAAVAKQTVVEKKPPASVPNLEVENVLSDQKAGAGKDTTQLLDLKYIQSSKPLPTKEDYPGALAALFSPPDVSNAIHNACAKLKFSMQTEIDFKARRDFSNAELQSLHPGLQAVQVCELKLEIPDVCQETAVGEGISKQTAKQAAWLHTVSKLHVAGALKELFPSHPTAQPVDESSVDEYSDPIIEPADIDKQTMEEEKDAKTEIYNYAASLGLIPQFETKIVQPRTPRARLGRTPKKPKPLYQTSIRLQGQGIDATGSGKDVQTAETAAAIAFKEQAEKQYTTAGGNQSPTLQSAFAVLNVDSAKQFFEFYKNREAGLNIEVEHEKVVGAATYNRATLTINGAEIGEAAIMRTKAQAESVAYLTSAVEIASTQPQLLNDFAELLRKGKGKILRPLSSIDLEVGAEALQTMRHALVEARDAGLSDSRHALNAELPQTTDENLRRTWRLSTRAHEVASEQLHLRQRRFDASSNLAELRSKKAALPMNNYADDVLGMIDQNQYSIVIGATGSGKTTQVPQILFERAIKDGHGSSCNIICTQPRRIAATSVAQRVAVERDEALRKTVGYHVRFDAKLPYEPYGITYCTTGVLLERLKHNPDDALDTTSHIIIDEVHERDLNIDFLMIVLKRAIRVRQADGRPVPKVVLMSATLDAELFADYFHQTDSAGIRKPCPSLNVPGRTYPVKEKYLGSIMHEMLEKHGAGVKALLDGDLKSSDYLKAETEFSASQGQADPSAKTERVIDWKRERPSEFISEDDIAIRREKEEALVPISLVAAVVAHACTESSDGAVLAFLPGLEEILDVQKLLLDQHPLDVDFSDTSKFQICLLHSTVPKEQQAEVFRPSPRGCRKIILSTNIAETSVTVPEVKYVVDTGKLRETRYDQVRRITRLQCVWESKSNSKQRAGRAGRVQDGFYYALFSKERNLSLRSVGLPELLRSDLQETCLSIKAQNFGEPVASFLAQAIEPPSRKAIDAAVQNLISIEAFTADEDLTALGRVLSQLPVHPALSKMIILGVIFRCLDPMILLGASAEERSLFVSPPHVRREAARAYQAYGGDSQSDHIAFLKAFNELRTIRDEFNLNAAGQRARENFLHMGAFRAIDQNAKQILDILEHSGLFVHDHFHRSGYGPPDLNRNAKNYELVRALLLAGFNPNLATKTSSHGIVFRTPTEQSVLMHPSSLNAEAKKSDKAYSYGALFAYSNLSKSTDGNTLFLRDSTRVTPLMAVLFGGQLRMIGDGRLEMDEWLPLFVKASNRQFSTRLILEFRKALDRVLNSAFSSLSNLTEAGSADLASDPMREKFAQRVVEILEYASGKHLLNAFSHPGFRINGHV